MSFTSNFVVSNERERSVTVLFKHHIPEEFGRIYNATQSDMALGIERFKGEIETLIERRVTSKKRGRKPSQMD
ncbi:hypothetical protein [Marinomonas atlantica]|uniref:hypothetical protein n=1 Tax=Marinomonas atlantica TaxID=1806668 RepID=UPI000829E6A5|nr:hypothetical protein [Marinomonas atlantica]